MVHSMVYVNSDTIIINQVKSSFPHSVATAFRHAFFGRGSGEIWLDDVQCNGTEHNLSRCLSNGIGVHNCYHSEDAGVRCESMVVRLLIEIESRQVI